ncbi:hypothetical protein Patl1_17578 [Pistacia atlantica]|uniref:Uncharacterized protein n=1 Tax=Pistacia atlantica TaxID=434234 RepID=A0ACC1C1U1_9ROSI|nr:hypothetical protein Patl1_17578 [Pistacia atlantica]
MRTENNFIRFVYGIRAMGDEDKKDVETFGLDKKTQNLYSLNPNDNPRNIITQTAQRPPGQGGGRVDAASRNKPGISQANTTQASSVDGGRGAGSDSDRKGLSGLNDE